MLFLEEHFKEEADHVTAMGNTTCIFHKNKGNQRYDSPHSMIPPVSDKEAVRVRAGCASVSLKQSQAFCSPCDLIDLGNEDISPGLSLQRAAYHVRWLFFLHPSLKTEHKPTLGLHSMQAALLCSSSLQGRGMSAASPGNTAARHDSSSEVAAVQ